MTTKTLTPTQLTPREQAAAAWLEMELARLKQEERNLQNAIRGCQFLLQLTRRDGGAR